MTTTSLSALEAAAGLVIARQISRDDGTALIEQLQSATVTSREFTGFGFFTEFEVNRSLPQADVARCPDGWVEAKVGPDAYPLHFMLYVRDGFAEMMEAYSYMDGCGDLDLLTAEFTPPRPCEPNIGGAG